MILRELSRVQNEQGWVSPEAAHAVAEKLRVPLHRVEGLLSFYPSYRRTPPPRWELALCRDLPCYLAGGDRLLCQARTLARDGVEVREVSCLGRCDEAPATLVNHEPLTRATAAALAAVADGSTPPPAPEPAPSRRPWRVAAALPGPPPPALPADLDADAVVAALRAAGLRGMGGAGFPTADKWALVRGAPQTPKYVICNADESEPGTFKDRVILEELPELVLEGIALAARVVGAERAIVYLRHEYGRARRSLEAALEAARVAGALPCPVEIFVSPGGYVLGEETALLEALEDRRGEPRNKPPFPGTHGLFGKPTLINNVETLLFAAVIARRGADWWKAQGRRGASGLKFVSVSGHVAHPGVYEVPLGTTVAELLAEAGGIAGGRRLLAFAPGGASSSFLPADKVDVPLDFAAMQQAGSMLGSGALMVVAEGTDLLAVATNVVRFFRNESCGKCVPCRVGTEKAVQILEDVLAGRRGRSDLDALDELDETMRLTSICGLGQVALNPITSIRRHFGV